jgi:glucose-6-phosphate dehydrogenase assembly protein OpcA
MIDVTESRDLAIDTRTIESELAAVWRDASERGLARASSLTLLVVLTDPALTETVDDVLVRMAPSHPCRIVVLALDDGIAEPHARLAAHCQLGTAGRPTSCWEDIRLAGRRSDLNRLLSAGRALLLPNLPVQVWWPGSPNFEGPLFVRLVEVGDRIIIDSAQCQDPLAALCRYADQSEEQHGTVGFVDLTWRGLEPWRLSLAQFFDAPADRLHLNGIRSVMVSFEQSDDGGRAGFAEALLLVGWLASRLGWVVADEQALDAVLFDDGARGVRIHFRRVPSGERSRGELSGVELRASSNGRLASFVIEKSGASGTAVTVVDGTRREVQLSLPARTEAELLEQELRGYGRDRIYEEALQVVRALGRRTGKSSRSK